MIAHICQQGKGSDEPQTGLWFLTVEEDDGRLWLHSHGGTKADMEEEADHMSPAPADTLYDKVPHRAYPHGGLAPDAVKPAPRKVV
jgi:hypothetical protein